MPRDADGNPVERTAEALNAQCLYCAWCKWSNVTRIFVVILSLLSLCNLGVREQVQAALKKWGMVSLAVDGGKIGPSIQRWLLQLMCQAEEHIFGSHQPATQYKGTKKIFAFPSLTASVRAKSCLPEFSRNFTKFQRNFNEISRAKICLPNFRNFHSLPP